MSRGSRYASCHREPFSGLVIREIDGSSWWARRGRCPSSPSVSVYP